MSFCHIVVEETSSEILTVLQKWQTFQLFFFLCYKPIVDFCFGNPKVILHCKQFHVGQYEDYLSNEFHFPDVLRSVSNIGLCAKWMIPEEVNFANHPVQFTLW